jgi:hypothetical protein
VRFTEEEEQVLRGAANTCYRPEKKEPCSKPI